MDRDFRKGHIEIDFPAEPFDSPLPLLNHSIRVFLSNLPFLAAATLVIYLPGKLATQSLCYFAAMFLVLDRVQGVTHSRVAFAIADSVLAVGGQLTTVAALLMYLGTVQKRVTKLKP